MASTERKLSCVLPWKALFMDERDGRLAALPCCLGWIKETYGFVDEAPLPDLWNSPGAQRIRALIAAGREDEICDRGCGYLRSGLFGEAAWENRIQDGPADFTANQRLNNAEVRARKTVLRSRPVMLKVIPNLSCNIRCTMCFQTHFGSAGHGADFWDEIEALLPYAHEATFQGGEVTTNAAFRAFLAGPALRRHPQVGIGLITNGTVLDQALQDAVAQVRMQFVSVSVNAARRETYRAVAQCDLFDRVVANLRRWTEIAERHERGRFPVYASFVVMRSTFEDLPAFVRLVQAIGARPRLQFMIGDRHGENVLLRPELHAGLHRVLDEAGNGADAEAAAQIEHLAGTLAAATGRAPAIADPGTP